MMIRRRISVDFTIPPGYVAFEESSGGGDTSADVSLFFVPVALLRKWPPLMKLDIRGEEDEPLPLLTTDKNREIDAAVLTAVARLYLEDHELCQVIDAHLVAIAASSATGATEAARHLRDALVDFAARSFPEDEAREFARDRADPLVTFATGLVANSLLWVRVKGKPRDRKIVKIAFEDPLKEEASPRRRLFTAFSWQAIAAEYEIPHIGQSGIYHCQIDPPPELQMVSAELALDDPPVFSADLREEPSDTAETEERIRLVSQASESLYHAARLRYRELLGRSGPSIREREEPESSEAYSRVTKGRAHLYVSGARKNFGIASVRMAVASRALATAALVSATAIALVMTALVIFAGTATETVGPTVTVLLLVPGLLGFLARPREHPVVAEYLTGVRVLTLVSAAMPIAAALALLSIDDPTGASVRPSWAILTAAAWIVALLLVPSWLLPAAPFGGNDDDLAER